VEVRVIVLVMLLVDGDPVDNGMNSPMMLTVSP
jgi:hypothetical protein